MNRSIFSIQPPEARETGGVWRDYPTGHDNPPGFLIARAGPRNVAYGKLLEKLTRPQRQAKIDLDTVAPEKQRAIMGEVYAHTIVKGWRNVFDDEGKPIEFSPAVAQDILSRIPDLLSWLQVEAQNAGNFFEEAAKEEAGN